MAKDARNAEKHAALEMLKTGMNSHVPQIIRAALLEAGSRLGPVLLTLECTLKKKITIEFTKCRCRSSPLIMGWDWVRA